MPAIVRASGRFVFSRKEALFALGGGLALSAGLIMLLRPAEGGDSTPAVATVAPIPLSTVAVPLPVPGPAAVPARAASASGLVLYGVLGGAGDRASAIIGTIGGSQRLVRVGREAAPGVVLRSVERAAALLDEGEQTVRLVLVDGSGRSALEPVAAAAAPGEAGGAYRQRDARTETIEFRLALMPRTEGGRVTGYALKPGAGVPLFERAGLRPGDVIYLLNGRSFASEREIEGLSREVAVSRTIVLGYERAGKLMEARVDIDR